MDISDGAYISPNYIACKMKSEQAIGSLIAIAPSTSEVNCRDINERIYNEVGQYVENVTREVDFAYLLQLQPYGIGNLMLSSKLLELKWTKTLLSKSN